MLSPEQFAELVALIQTTHADGPKPEVRRAQRVSHPCRMSITLGSDETAAPTHLVQVKDISSRGMCFLYHEEIPRGTVFIVKLEGPGGKDISILSTIVHCRQLDPSTHQFGAEFNCVVGQKPEVPEPMGEDLMRIRVPIPR